MTSTKSSRWKTQRLRFATRRGPTNEQRAKLREARQVTFVPMEAIGENGEFNVSDVRDIEEVNTGYSLFFDGDVVVAKITPCFENGKGAVVRGTLNGVGFGTTELHVLSPLDSLDSHFLYWITVSQSFRELGTAWMTGAAGQKRVTEDFVRDFPVPIIPIATQRAVAEYLERETGRIDGLVIEKKRLLRLLEDKRQALITRIVTRGLNPRIPLRNSGLPWLDLIPEHWQTRRIAFLFRDRDERGEPELPLLEVSINHGVTLREFSEDKIESTASDFNSYKIARKGDIVFNKMRMWQGAVGVAPVDGLTSPDYTVAQPIGPFSASYAEVLFRTPIFSAECARNSNGIVWDRLRLYWEGFRDIRVPVPPLGEQNAIVSHISVEVKKMDMLLASAERSIALLKERRAALVTAAVTGNLQIA